MNRTTSIGLLLILIASIILSGFTPHTMEKQSEYTYVSIAALLPLSGELSSKGKIRKLAIEKGVEDANARWQLENSHVQFALEIIDSHSDPTVALEQANRLWHDGVRIFIVGSSSEVESLQQWAHDKEVIIISYSSTSPTLGIAGDGIFRMVPNDLEQAKALAELLVFDGIYGIVPVYRNDIYGNQLVEHLIGEFTEQFGIVSAHVIYEPLETNWSDVSSRITEEVEQLGLKNEQIGIVLISFDEITDILLASEPSPDIRWYGADTVTLSPAVLNDLEAAEIAHQVQLKGTTFGLTDSEALLSIQNDLLRASDGIVLPDALFAYDIPNMLASIIDQLGQSTDIQSLKDFFVEGSATYAGITGWTILDEQGDRKYYHYDIWEVKDSELTYNWEKVAKYIRSPGVPGFINPVIGNDGEIEDQDASYLFGYPDLAFDVERSISRAEFTLMLMSALKGQFIVEESTVPTFIDQDEIDYRALNEVAVAQKLGIIQGYGNDDFRPNRDITWFEAISMVVKVLDLDADDVTDVPEYSWLYSFHIPDWAENSVLTAIVGNIISPLDHDISYLWHDFLLGDAILLIFDIMQREAYQ